MPAAIHLSGQLHARAIAANIQGATTLGSVNLVPGDGHQVDVVLDHVHRNFTNRLHAVGVEQHAFALGQLADLGDRLQHADFVVGVHDADQDGLVRDGFSQHFEIDQTVGLHRQIGRSEEHTSELQSPDHLVCRLLLEKKKNYTQCNE